MDEAQQKSRIQWINDAEMAMSFNLTTAERIVLLGNFYDRAHLAGQIMENQERVKGLDRIISPGLKRQAL